jgi:hypothetical protein
MRFNRKVFVPRISQSSFKEKNMKSIKVFALVAVLSLIAFASVQAQSSLETGAVAYFTDISGVYADGHNGFAANGNQKDKYAPTVQPYINYLYTMKMDPLTLKLGLYLEDWIGLYQGASKPYEFQMAGKADPSAELLFGGLDVKVSFPQVMYSPADTSGVNELKFAYKTYSYGPNNEATYDATKSYWSANYDKVAYKIAFDSTTSLTLGAEADFLFVPVTLLLDAKPQFSFVYGPAQLDCKFDFYFMDPAAAANVQGYYFYLEPKLTFDFTSLGIAGLKAFVQANRWALATSATKYTSAAPWHGTAITPGVSFKFPFGLYAEGDLKMYNVDANPSGDTNDKNMALYFEPQIKLSYTISF